MQVDLLSQGVHDGLEAHKEAIHTKTTKMMMCDSTAAIFLCGGMPFWETSLEQMMELISLCQREHHVLEIHNEAIQTPPSRI